jgi:hypothetical protein
MKLPAPTIENVQIAAGWYVIAVIVHAYAAFCAQTFDNAVSRIFISDATPNQLRGFIISNLFILGCATVFMMALVSAVSCMWGGTSKRKMTFKDDA